MKKIVAIYSGYPSTVNNDINTWMNEHTDIDIISVNGVRGDGNSTVTYILYEDKPEGLSLDS